MISNFGYLVGKGVYVLQYEEDYDNGKFGVEESGEEEQYDSEG